MKFLADGMLGKLTRWLRILGHDVKYSTSLSDEILIAMAKKERRVLLTSDFELYQKSTSNKLATFYVEVVDNTEQLARISKRFAFPLKFDFETSRCPKCNAKLRPTAKEKIAGKVKKNTLDRYTEFWFCPKCKQIYWHGAHWGRIRATLRKAESELKLS